MHIGDLSPEAQRRIQIALDELSGRKGSGPTTFDGLLHRWSNFAAEVERGYGYSLYDYTNDLTVRDRLEDLVRSLPPDLGNQLPAAFASADARFTNATEPYSKPLMNRPYDWWRRVPKKRSGEFESDLGGV